MGRVVRFVSLYLAALNLGAAYAHILEMGPKRRMSGPEWLSAQRAYSNFGPASGATFPGALISTLLSLVGARGDRTGTALTAAGLACSAATVAIWAKANEPVNHEIVHWKPDDLPANWSARRDQWEFAHAISAVLHALGFAALLATALRDVKR